jgi:uncharacterized membrane protein YphA (DoxX/SURF4 family)
VPFERSILVVALLATVAFVGAGAYSFFDPQLDEMRLHVLLTLGAVLLVVFPHLWIGLYLVGTGRAIRREVAEGRAEPSAAAESRRHLRRALPPLLLASLAALSTIAFGQAILAGTAQPWHHLTAFVVTLLLQLWALQVERQALTQNAKLLDRLDATAN